MSSSESTTARCVTFDVDVRTDLPFFLISEGIRSRGADITRPRGLVSGGGGGEVKLLVDAGAQSVAVRFQIAEEKPVDVSEKYEDVVQRRYWSPRGEPVVLDWEGSLAGLLGRLPAGPGDYELRYHLRSGRSEGTQEALVQLWPAPAEVEHAIKVDGRLGQFWHPRCRLENIAKEEANRA
ncbi:hypothetical protein [Amycolatopsis sp. WQ 127309]|uniref:hypothetical protein n=1 Tax=Amycolatopsis sp. WQ 127309 TaxID=2932773 RepID=UPI001FF573A0|nr:hypothetical protein [Amycolatopsis sp. WQ 127309]UOZ06946.1 hypothetical protein MUY22_01225 [Amycolatopsis sp. WQ 127309]